MIEKKHTTFFQVSTPAIRPLRVGTASATPVPPLPPPTAPGAAPPPRRAAAAPWRPPPNGPRRRRRPQGDRLSSFNKPTDPGGKGLKTVKKSHQWMGGGGGWSNL